MSWHVLSALEQNLVRLGQRVIQKENAATTILKNFSALSKGLVHDVYLSNDQLDGAKIMDANGMTFALHAVYDDGQFLNMSVFPILRKTCR
jgi:hypothetical protein